MIRIRDLSLPPDSGRKALEKAAARQLHLPPEKLTDLTLRRRSVDARKKQDVRVIYTVDVQVDGREDEIIQKAHSPKVSAAPMQSYQPPRARRLPVQRPVIVGFGPAGMFCALILSLAGARPIVLERGQDARTRHEKVQAFWRGGALDTECNVQFGEGGAGTFSDGKLNTGVHNPRIGWVLEQFVSAGADESILYEAKPHIGTDALVNVVQKLRGRVVENGGEVRFGWKLTALHEDGGRLCAIDAQHDGLTERIACDTLVLAIGHSARDTFEMLCSSGLPMQPKPFSMGVRLEHRQKTINDSQYGAFSGSKELGAADYKLNVVLPDGGSAYTFCMCPGGSVVAAASEEGGVVTNGMSEHARDGQNANAALLVTLHPEDFPDQSTLGGMHWQRQIEQAAFACGGGSYKAPCQLVGDFLAHRPSTGARSVQPSYRPGVVFCDLHTVLPRKLTDVLEQAIPALAKRLRGYDEPDAVMTAPETRSSSPVRIVRGENRQSALAGVYPCGEGAGYAGGIMSAALDGIQTAEAILGGEHG